MRFPPQKRGLTGAPYTTNGLVHYFQGSFRLCNRIVRWLVRPKHFPDSETLPRIQKHFPESKTLPTIQKHFPESKTLPRIQKHFAESRFWDVFWILGSVLESGKCLVLMSHRSIEFKLFFVNYGNS